MRLPWLLGALLLAAPAAAHQETVAYSRLVIRESGDVEYALKIPVEDLAESLGRQGHTALNAPEVKGAENQLFDHFQPLVGMTSGGRPCPAERSGIEVPEDDRLYGELRFTFHCPPGAPVTLDYRVFFDVDPGHMGMLEVESPGGKTRAELIVERPRWEVDASGDGPPQLRTVGSTAPLPLEKGQPVAGGRPLVAEPVRSAEDVGLVAVPEAPGASNGAAPAPAPRRARSHWLLVVLALTVATAAGWLTMRLARRRPSVPSR